MGTRNVFSAASQDCTNKFVASERVLGSPLMHPIPDIDNMDFLMIIGGNPVVSKMSFAPLARPEEHFRGIEKRGGRVIIIDPRRTETVKFAGEHHFIRPDTDCFLLATMLHVIIREKLYDAAHVQRHTRGFDDLARFVDDFPPARVAGLTGIDADTMIGLARDFAKARNACVYNSVGVNMGSFGTVGYWLVHCLNILTNRFDVRGSQILPETPGPIDMGRLLKMAAAFAPKRKSRIGDYAPVLDCLPAGILADEILTPGEGQIKALIVLSGNPLLSLPDAGKVRKAFASLDLLVSLDLFRNETGGMSDYILPSTDMYERRDMAINGFMFSTRRFLNYTDAVVEAEGECRDLWLGFYEVLRAAGYPMTNKAMSTLKRTFGLKDRPGFNPNRTWAMTAQLTGFSWSKLKKARQGILQGEQRLGRFYNKRVLTKGHKADLAPPEYIARKEALENFLKTETAYAGFRLIGQRQRHTHNTWFHNVRSFMEKEITNRMTIHPADAAKLSIQDGDMALVQSATASIKIPVNISDEIMPGVVSIPHGWGHQEPSGLSVASAYPGVNVNILLPSGPEAVEKFSGMAHMTGIHVHVSKAV